MNIAQIENSLYVISGPTGVATYDFDFETHFSCKHPYMIQEKGTCVLRMGAIADYAKTYAAWQANGLVSVNSPEQHALASELENWYPLIKELTPFTEVYDSLPSVEEIENRFSWPIFLKGSRQTSKHNPELSIIHDRGHYARAVQLYRNDAILHWQKPAVREFVPLESVAGNVVGKISPSMEYRSFWWQGECVGWGRYWYQVCPYECADVSAGLAVAAQAAARLPVPFLVIDFARTADDRWIVIECNDAQESGYAGVPVIAMWKRVLQRLGVQ